MAQDASELVVASFGRIHVAEYGTPLPAAGDDPTDALDSDFKELGFVTEDGVSFSTNPEVQEFRAWQSPDPVRREVTSRATQLTFSLEQWNEDTIAFAFGGGTMTDHGGGIYSYLPPGGQDSLDERSLVVDWNDGDKNYRVVVPRGSVSEATETQLQRAALAELPITFGALAAAVGQRSWYLLSDDPAWSGAAS